MIKAKKLISSLSKIYNNFFKKVEPLLSYFLLLTMRLWIANVFFKSGRNKFANMDSTIYLFEYEYDLPLISPVIAAYCGTFFELLCPILIVLGVLTRVAVLPLIFMTLIIQLLVVQNIEHFYWLFLLSTIFIYGGGKMSTDKFLKIK
jgi:putative oxidoreductase